MYLLGISAFYHDSAACLLRDGELIAAAQEERFTRKKHDPGFPSNAIQSCLDQAGIALEHVEALVFYDKPFVKFERLAETYLAVAPLGIRSFIKAMPLWLKEKLDLRRTISKTVDFKGSILFSDHHQSHAASAFYPSPYQEAAFLTVDGVGEWTTTSYGIGRGPELEFLKEIHFPHSLGMLYSAFTYYTGFRVNSGEYKLMGLAPYGEPKYAQTIRDHLIDVHEDGSYRLHMRYFNYLSGLTMTNARFDCLFGGPPRKAESPITQREMDIAASVQVVLEEILLKIVRHVHKETGQKNLCLAGGVALNCVANGRILREGPFENLWIQPASSDSGGALGAAFAAWHRYYEKPRFANNVDDAQKGSLLGPSFSDDEIRRYLDQNQIPYQQHPEAELYETVAQLLDEGAVVGWFQGPMEFGPRALGARSILGDPRSAEMQSRLNLKIKFRESFRPFAPSALEEHAGEYFDVGDKSPYMLLTGKVSENCMRPISEADAKKQGLEKLSVLRSTIPAVTHVNGSARLQTVSAKTNPRFHKLLQAFHKRTGCPVLINTSFNVRGEPIVCTPQDAYNCFRRTFMDYLVMGNIVLEKKKVDSSQAPEPEPISLIPD
ncbi:MAG: carbamoyltransferase [Candidatus Omnitrophica bacterium]|nr:carbamoyltransferase [Candidatus Omnitrophota bacterium]